MIDGGVVEDEHRLLGPANLDSGNISSRLVSREHAARGQALADAGQKQQPRPPAGPDWLWQAMPLADFGSLVLNHALFLIHLVYISLAFAHAESGLLVVLYLVSKLLARRPEDLDPALWQSWPPAAPKW
ncbi:hypothetical protein CDD82_3467 [Ophiocordyceps australis]|uniref:Uncharacterized protein n=2 Tax=Ophiocordyceps australis TaxID=1399860 RepID=A0A2C5ZCE5_9HYPO|nr:hypothetical protein CDD82_3467 [Ophiocordyceps australis]